jgi:hypothetical protein
MRRKRIIIGLIILWGAAFPSIGQGIQIGAEYGLFSDTKFAFPGSYGSLVVDYQLKSSNIAFCFEPAVIVQDNSQLTGSLPLSVKYRIGDLWKLAPELGLFYWTTGRGGLIAGVSLERTVAGNWIPYVTSGFWNVFYKDSQENELVTIPALNFGLGLKYQFK